MTSGFASYPQASFEEFLGKLEESVSDLPKQEAKLAQFILLNLKTLGLETGKSLAAKVGVSEVTVGRLLRRLGCNGMKALKVLLREQYSVSPSFLDTTGDIHPTWETTHAAELAAVTSVFQQTTSESWQRATELLAASPRIFVSGFQSVRGIAEDFTRRLSLARDSVQYMSPHDGMLGEWLVASKEGAGDSCVVLIDVVPYASEGIEVARLARRQGRSCVVVSDEYCHWSRDIADATIYAPSKTGLFLESTVGIVVALSLLVDAVAKSAPEVAAERLAQWKTHAKQLGLF
jgi:DNA-binding MurR/RpiR family transcriptional regulator